MDEPRNEFERKAATGRLGMVPVPTRRPATAKDLRGVALMVAGGAAIFALAAGADLLHDADLRDVDRLTRTTATVTDLDERHRRADLLVVEFDAAGTAVRASVPSDQELKVGTTVEVGYVPDDPTRVRTLTGWSPTYSELIGRAGLFTLGTVGLGIAAALHGRGERHRGKGRPRDDQLAPARVDKGLGVRIVRSGRRATFLVPAILAVPAVGLTGYGLTAIPANTTVAGGGAGLIGLSAAVGVLLHAARRDGVWATEEHLVARRGFRTRRWPWTQVLNLGVVGGPGQVGQVAAELDGGGSGSGPRGWVTLARPAVSPDASRDGYLRLARLAQDHHLPFTDDPGPDLADSGGGSREP